MILGNVGTADDDKPLERVRVAEPEEMMQKHIT
jgi:hypothetical protein